MSSCWLYSNVSVRVYVNCWSLCICSCVRICVCERERDREREIGRERERETQWKIGVIWSKHIVAKWKLSAIWRMKRKALGTKWFLSSFYAMMTRVLTSYEIMCARGPCLWDYKYNHWYFVISTTSDLGQVTAHPFPVCPLIVSAQLEIVFHTVCDLPALPGSLSKTGMVFSLTFILKLFMKLKGWSSKISQNLQWDRNRSQTF